MLWVYDQYKYFYPYSAGIDYRRHNLTSTDVRLWRLRYIPAQYGLCKKWNLVARILYTLSADLCSLQSAFDLANAMWTKIGTQAHPANENKLFARGTITFHKKNNK